MSGKPSVIPSIKLTTSIPLDSYTRMTSYLFSEAEGRVPKGAYQRFLTERINEFFKRTETDAAT